MMEHLNSRSVIVCFNINEKLTSRMFLNKCCMLWKTLEEQLALQRVDRAGWVRDVKECRISKTESPLLCLPCDHLNVKHCC